MSRRAVANQLHRFAYWIDRQADRIFNTDEIIRAHLQAGVEPYLVPTGDQVAVDLKEALDEILRNHNRLPLPVESGKPYEYTEQELARVLEELEKIEALRPWWLPLPSSSLARNIASNLRRVHGRTAR